LNAVLRDTGQEVCRPDDAGPVRDLLGGAISRWVERMDTKGFFVCLFLGTLVVAGLYLCCVNPEVVMARLRFHRGTKRWDRFLLGFLLPAVYAVFIVAALDNRRFRGLAAPWWVRGLGYVLFLIGVVIITWAEAVNRFFEKTARIQTDRGHRVIDTGPYAIVRHPGYVGFMMFFVGSALCLGSLWALIPACLASALLLLRTHWEDQTLQAELPGYKEYAQRVRYKLIPGVW
jgi:protein-S-isoprenylcysteine O-methyltransferase Ste14